MKQLITTVGTSVITNWLRNGTAYSHYFDRLKNKTAGKTPDLSSDGAGDLINEAKKHFTDKSSQSAEIASILKIKEHPDFRDEDFSVHLICSDTVVSVLAAQLITAWFQTYHGNSGISFSSPKIISGLQVKNFQLFEKEGLHNLADEIQKIGEAYLWPNLILNITGGYKAVTPYMTILGQVNEVPICYIFEESDAEHYELMIIPKSPLTFDTHFFETYYEWFEKLSNPEGTVLTSELPPSFITDASGCLFQYENMVELSPIGKLLWKKYADSIFVFYASREVCEKIKSSTNLSTAVSGGFAQKSSRDYISQKKTSSPHRAYSKGKNEKIFWIQKKDRIYIYKVFEIGPDLHDDYEYYLSNEPLNEEKIINSSIRCVVKKTINK